ncbi:MAG: chloramphenicol acetyltransferase [Acidobacteriota bacterium]
MPRFLDLENWPRRATFEFFRGYDNPYFNICAPLDAGPLVDFVKATPGTSLFLAYLYLSLRIANEMEQFRYRLSGGHVLIHDRIHAGTTIPIDDDRFDFAYLDYDEDFGRFQAAAKEALALARASGGKMEARDDRTDLVHYSAAPWISFTSISHARNWKREDSVPKIVFGKVSEQGGRRLIPVSVEVHHALMDGLHVGRYLERLQESFLAPAAGLRQCLKSAHLSSDRIK